MMMDLEQELSTLSRITGINVEETESTTLSESDELVIKHHMHTGHCFNLLFCMEYDITFKKNTASSEWADQEYDLSNIIVSLDRKLLSNEFSALIQRNAEIASLADAYSILCGYAKLHNKRHQCFKANAEEFSANVELYSEDSIRVSHNRGFSAVIKWKIKPGPDGQAKSSVTLTLSSKNTRDFGGIMESAPAMFDGLKRKFGISKAIDVLVKQILHYE